MYQPIWICLMFWTYHSKLPLTAVYHSKLPQRCSKQVIMAHQCKWKVTLNQRQCSPPTVSEREATVPVQVKGSDLRIVPLKVGEVEKVYIRLCISGLSA